MDGWVQQRPCYQVHRPLKCSSGSQPLLSIGVLQPRRCRTCSSLLRRHEHAGFSWLTLPSFEKISAFATDFSNARGRAEQLDARLISAANAISSDYADLLSIAARQVYGATELTIAKGSDGQFNKSDVMMFMRNIGGGDSAQCVDSSTILRFSLS